MADRVDLADVRHMAAVRDLVNLGFEHDGWSVGELVAEVLAAADAVDRVREATNRIRQLHQIEHRYQSSRDDDWSVDTPEEAADVGECDLAEVVFFDVCAHCASTETHEGSYDGSYLYSLWPCPTVAILDGDPK